MIENLKALIVVLAIAALVFAVAKPICLRFMTEDDFSRRRGIWFALTIAAFASPNFWLFVAVALPLLAWGARKDSNPLALYILVFCVIPPTIKLEIPVVGINSLFELSLQRILAFAILIPVAWRLIRSKDNNVALRFTAMDMFVLAYAGLHIAILMPHDSATNALRRVFLHFMDVMVLYFVASRACSSRQAIVEILATFGLLCAILAPLAVFESQRHWLLYQGPGSLWVDNFPNAYLSIRDGSLRAQVSVGQSIPLGYLLAFGFGLWLYLGSRLQSGKWNIAVAGLMWAGMIAAHARAPWIVAAFIYFVCRALGPHASTRLVKAALLSALFFGLVLISPIGGRVIDNLPFVGTIGAENVEYRQLLAATAWEKIKLNPVFGDPLVLTQLESLRQGEGIIDLVNTYAQIAMFYGVPALFFYLAPYLIGIWNAYRQSRRTAHFDPDLSFLGAFLVACMLGFLLAMAMGGYGPYPQSFGMVVIGIAVGYARLEPLKETPRGEPARLTRSQPLWNIKRG